MTTRIGSGSGASGLFKPVDVLEVGKPGWPGQLIIHNGQLLVYGPNGETLIEDGKITTNAIDVNTITAEHIIAGSITTDKLEDGGVSNVKISKWSRAKQAVVGPSSDTNVDFNNLTDAIAYIKGIGGGAIFLSPGTYDVATNILTSNCPHLSIIGVDPDLCVVNIGGYNATLSFTNCNDLYLENFTIQDSTSASGGLYAYGSTGIQLKNLQFNGNAAIDANLYYCNNVLVENCTNASSYELLKLGNCNNVVVQHCQAPGGLSSNGAIWIYGGSYITLFDNYIQGHQSASNGAIYVQYATSVKIIDNTIKECNGHGIYVPSSFDRSLIQGNTCYKNLGSGIYLTGISNNVIVSENHTTYNTGEGIYINTSQRITASNNVSTNNTGSGFYIYAAGGSPFTANLLNENSAYGVRLGGGAAYIMLVANTMHWNGVATIYNPGITGLIDEHNSKLG